VIDATATTQLDADNPWPGLEAFEENARAFFHGRDHEAESLLNHVLDASVTVLYGRSGLGKTSLLRAGLFPLLRERNFLPVYVRFDIKPGAPPLTRQLHESVQKAIRADVPDAMLPLDDEPLWEYLHRSDFELWSAQNYQLTPVIVLDQFEELFTLGERVSDLVRAFRDDLGDLAENRIPADLGARIDGHATVAARLQLRSRKYKLLISLREDFLPELEGWRQLIPALGQSRLRLLRLQAGEAFDAVQKPAAHMMTGALARRVVGIIAGRDLHRGSDTALPDGARPGDEIDAAEVEPALLSLFCRELNEERKRRGQSHFDEQLIEHAKSDILSNYYLSCVGDLPSRVAEFIESELITEKGFRNSYAREDAVPSHLTDDELNRLIRMRLLRLEERYGAQRIELTHDVLTGVVREHRDQRRAEEEKAALAARAEQERQAAAQREAQLEAEKQRQQTELQAARKLAAVEAAAKEEAQAREAVLRKRTRTLRIAVVVALVIAVVAVVALVWAAINGHIAKQRFYEATSVKLNADAQGMLAGTLAGGDVRAFEELLVARSLNPPDGGLLYSAVVKRQSTIKIIETPTRINRLAFSPDGRRIASASQDSGDVSIWDADTGASHTLASGEKSLSSVAFSLAGDRIAAGTSETGYVVFWDARTGERIGKQRGNEGGISSIDYSRDGHRLVSGGFDYTVQIWNADTGQPSGPPLKLRRFRTEPGAGVEAVAFSPDGRRIAVGCGDDSVRILDADTGQRIVPPLWIVPEPGHGGGVTSVAFSPDGHQLVAASGAGGSFQIWNAETGEPIGDPVRGDHLGLYSVAFSPGGHRIVTGGADGTVRLWDAASRQRIGRSLTGHQEAVLAVAFSPDGHRIASGAQDRTIRLWNADLQRPLIAAEHGFDNVDFSRHRDRIATVDFQRTAQVWSATSGKPISPPMQIDQKGNIGVLFSPDGRRLITGGEDDDTLRLWNADTGDPIGAAINSGHGKGELNDFAFSPDGQRVATSGGDGKIRLWATDTDGLHLIEKWSPPENYRVYALDFSPDGSRIAASISNGDVWFLNARTGDPMGEPLTGHPVAAASLVFSPDGRRLAAAGIDNTIGLWNIDHGKAIVKALTGHHDAVTSVAFSPDGRQLVSGDGDGSLRLWNADTGKPIGEGVPAAHTDTVVGVGFSADGQRIFSASHDGTVLSWPAVATPEDLCHKLTTNISHKQWDEWVSPHIHYIKACPTLPVATDDGSH